MDLSRRVLAAGGTVAFVVAVGGGFVVGRSTAPEPEALVSRVKDAEQQAALAKGNLQVAQKKAQDAASDAADARADLSAVQDPMDSVAGRSSATQNSVPTVSSSSAHPRASSPDDTTASPTTAAPRVKTSKDFAGTGYVVDHLTDDRTNFQDSYHDGDSCNDGYRYRVSIYDPNEVLVAEGKMGAGKIKNVQKHDGYVEFSCPYPFTFKLSGTSAAYVFSVDYMPYMTPQSFGAKAFGTESLRTGTHPTFKGIDE